MLSWRLDPSYAWSKVKNLEPSWICLRSSSWTHSDASSIWHGGGASVPTLRSRPPPVSERRADKGDAAAPFHARTAGATAPRLEPVARDTLISASPPQFHTLHLARRWFAGHSSRRNGGCGTEVASPSQMLSPGGFAMFLCTKSMRPLILCATRSPRPSAVLLQSYLNPRPPLEFQTNTTFGLPRLSTFD